MLDSHALADLIAELVGEHVERATAPLIARIADLEGRETVSGVSDRLDALERALPTINERAEAVERGLASLPVPMDGRDADPEVIRQMVAEAIASIPAPLDGMNGERGEAGQPGADGKDADPEVIRAMVADAVAAIPVPKDGAPGERGADGKDGRDGLDVQDIEVTQDGAEVEFAFTVGDVRSIFVVELPAGEPGPAGLDGADGKDGERGPEGPAGKLATVKDWSDGVHYEGDVVTFMGSTYQATKDTGKDPTGGDWICLAARGNDGLAAREMQIRGTWSPDATYDKLDVVALNGASFVAKQDEPGPCPGEGWQLMAAQGKRGSQGERGVGIKGDKGDPGKSVIAASVDEFGVVTLMNGDGTTVTCDLYPVLTKVAQ